MRIKSIEGLRGLATIMVMFSHIGVMFYPAFYWLDTSRGGYQNHLGNWDVWIGESPLGFILNGNTGVVLFLMITGFGSYQVFCKGERAVEKYVILRYFKLLILEIVGTIGIVVMQYIGCIFYSDAAEISDTPWLGEFNLEDYNYWKMLLENPMDSLSIYNGVLWTMKYIFIGSLMSVLISFVIGNMQRKWVVYLIAILILINMQQPYYICCVIGVAVAAEGRNLDDSVKLTALYEFLALVIGIYLAACPSGVKPDLFWYKWLPYFDYAGVYYHIVGSTLILIVTVYGRAWKHLMEGRILQFLGKYSASIYIVHLCVIISLSSYVLVKLSGGGVNYGTAAMTASLVTIFTSVLIAVFVNPLLQKLYKLLGSGYDRVFVKIKDI
jgi:peptidoglycan/LPS O-acetylase OafA/YrhL